MNIYNKRLDVRSDKDLKFIENETPHYLFFICSANHLRGPPKNLGETFGLQKEFLKNEIYLGEVCEDTW